MEAPHRRLDAFLRKLPADLRHLPDDGGEVHSARGPASRFYLTEAHRRGAFRLADAAEEYRAEGVVAAHGARDVPDEQPVVEGREFLAFCGHLVGGAHRHPQRNGRYFGAVFVDAFVEYWEHAVEDRGVALEDLVYEGDLGLREHTFGVPLEAILAQRRELRRPEYLVGHRGPVEADVEVGRPLYPGAEGAGELALGRSGRAEQEDVIAGDQGQDHAPHDILALEDFGVYFPFEQFEILRGLRRPDISNGWLGLGMQGLPPLLLCGLSTKESTLELGAENQQALSRNACGGEPREGDDGRGRSVLGEIADRGGFGRAPSRDARTHVELRTPSVRRYASMREDPWQGLRQSEPTKSPAPIAVACLFGASYRQPPQANAVLLQDSHGAFFESRGDRGQVLHEQPRLLRGPSSGGPAEEYHRRLAGAPQSQQRTEIRVGRDDNALFGGRQFEKLFVRGGLEIQVPHVYGVVAFVRQCPRDLGREGIVYEKAQPMLEVQAGPWSSGSCLSPTASAA